MKKILNRFMIFLGLVAIMPISSCYKSIEGFEKDPNNALDAPIESIIHSVQLGLIESYEGTNARLTAMWTQQVTGVDRQYASLDAYTVGSGDFSWFDSYYGTIQVANQAIVKANKVNNLKTRGMLRVMKAAIMGLNADLYGDIPFTEANSFPTIKFPKYDNQLNVYSGIQSLLDSAITDLGGSGSISAASDLLLGGSAAKWIAVANTLKARYYLHVGNYASAITSAQLGITSTANDLKSTHPTGTYQTDMNLWCSFLAYDRQGYVDASGSYLLTLLGTGAGSRTNPKTNESARQAFYFVPAAGDLNYGDGTPGTGGFFDAAASFPIVTYKENQLIIAEANMRQAAPNAANALAALNNVRASLATEYPTGTYTAYALTDFPGTGNPGASQNAALLAEIMEERYASLFCQIEVFNDLRRANNPLGLTAKNASGFPQRFFYPQTEVNANPNTPVQIQTDLFAKTRANGGTK